MLHATDIKAAVAVTVRKFVVIVLGGRSVKLQGQGVRAGQGQQTCKNTISCFSVCLVLGPGLRHCSRKVSWEVARLFLDLKLPKFWGASWKKRGSEHHQIRRFPASDWSWMFLIFRLECFWWSIDAWVNLVSVQRIVRNMFMLIWHFSLHTHATLLIITESVPHYTHDSCFMRRFCTVLCSASCLFNHFSGSDGINGAGGGRCWCMLSDVMR